jgi:methylenetetrahydrofolate--tRNA-(uracil-5-)-methyltransferase
LMAGRFAAAEMLGQDSAPPPVTTAMGSLLAHVTGGAVEETFQPMNVNFGLFPPLAERAHKKERKAAYSARALADLDGWLSDPKTGPSDEPSASETVAAAARNIAP